MTNFKRKLRKQKKTKYNIQIVRCIFLFYVWQVSRRERNYKKQFSKKKFEYFLMEANFAIWNITIKVICCIGSYFAT